MCAKFFAVEPSIDPAAALLLTDVFVVGTTFPVRVALNVNASVPSDPAAISPLTVKSVPIVRSAAILDDRVP